MNLRYILLIPLALMLSSVISGCFAYSKAKQDIADDLNEVMVALVKEKSGLWTRQDTISALRHLYKATNKPMIYEASDLHFRNDVLKNMAYYSLALVDKKKSASKIQGNKITSDSIMLVPERSVDGLAIEIQGFAECSTASIFAVSDQTVPGFLFALSILSMVSLFVWRRKQHTQLETELAFPAPAGPNIDCLKLTPMQRQLTQMLIDAPDKKVDKATLCTALWGNKSNAEESLYTLVRRTKTALADTNIEIICNRGDSYQLHINT